ncbi:hypothetical protein R3P38DRAFT_3449659 [Favolaschia claudopus]|uniref:Uncharacterized protein n=1 Tax=Favolaschia claudopus TaxID=2862362 RepID=A0AAW0CYJ0_9AGAR
MTKGRASSSWTDSTAVRYLSIKRNDSVKMDLVSWTTYRMLSHLRSPYVLQCSIHLAPYTRGDIQDVPPASFAYDHRHRSQAALTSSRRRRDEAIGMRAAHNIPRERHALLHPYERVSTHPRLGRRTHATLARWVGGEASGIEVGYPQREMTTQLRASAVSAHRHRLALSSLNALPTHPRHAPHRTAAVADLVVLIGSEEQTARTLSASTLLDAERGDDIAARTLDALRIFTLLLSTTSFPVLESASYTSSSFQHIPRLAPAVIFISCLTAVRRPPPRNSGALDRREADADAGADDEEEELQTHLDESAPPHPVFRARCLRPDAAVLVVVVSSWTMMSGVTVRDRREEGAEEGDEERKE